MQLISHPAFPAARYYSLGEPGPAIQHVWFCLAGHDQPVAELAAQLVNLDTPERLLILPQAPGLPPRPRLRGSTKPTPPLGWQLRGLTWPG